MHCTSIPIYVCPPYLAKTSISATSPDSCTDCAHPCTDLNSTCTHAHSIPSCNPSSFFKQWLKERFQQSQSYLLLSVRILFLLTLV